MYAYERKNWVLVVMSNIESVPFVLFRRRKKHGEDDMKRSNLAPAPFDLKRRGIWPRSDGKRHGRQPRERRRKS
jgi:hypothetical protein